MRTWLLKLGLIVGAVVIGLLMRPRRRRHIDAGEVDPARFRADKIS